MAKEFQIAEFSFEKLYKAYCDCRKHKSSTYQAMEFEFEREKNLYELYMDILENKYEIGRSICFVISEPKYREIWAGSFRDRIVHHLIYNAIYDRFVPRFIFDTYSCIVGRGTLLGAKRAAQFARNITQNYSKDAYFIKMDIKNYFVSINKHILHRLVMERIDEEREKWLADLIRQVIFHDPRKNMFLKSPKEMLDKLPKYKSLFYTSVECGLPIGNLTSQFFSNVYLNTLDQYAKHVLGCKYYLRYVDDILIIDKDPGFLNYAYAKINRFLIENLNLELNHKKKNINLVKRGFDFVGFVVKPGHTHLRNKTINKCFSSIEQWKKSKKKNSKEELLEIRSKVNSYLGMLRHVDGFNMRKRISNSLGTCLLVPDSEFSKLNVV